MTQSEHVLASKAKNYFSVEQLSVGYESRILLADVNLPPQQRQHRLSVRAQWVWQINAAARYCGLRAIAARPHLSR